jgi:hypothetical protein
MIKNIFDEHKKTLDVLSKETSELFADMRKNSLEQKTVEDKLGNLKIELAAKVQQEADLRLKMDEITYQEQEIRHNDQNEKTKFENEATKDIESLQKVLSSEETELMTLKEKKQQDDENYNQQLKNKQLEADSHIQQKLNKSIESLASKGSSTSGPARKRSINELLPKIQLDLRTNVPESPLPKVVQLGKELANTPKKASCPAVMASPNLNEGQIASKSPSQSGSVGKRCTYELFPKIQVDSRSSVSASPLLKKVPSDDEFDDIPDEASCLPGPKFLDDSNEERTAAKEKYADVDEEESTFNVTFNTDIDEFWIE